MNTRDEGWSPTKCRWCGGELAHHTEFSEHAQFHNWCYEAWAEWHPDEDAEEARASLEEDLERDREHDAAEWGWEG